MLYYKINVLEALKEKGYNTTILRRQKLITETALTAIRAGNAIHWTTIDKLCKLLQCQPGEIIGFTDDTKDLDEDDTPEEPKTKKDEKQERCFTLSKEQLNYFINKYNIKYTPEEPN